MIPKVLSEIWAVVAPAMGNHLWQSTLFAGVIGVLTLALRNNRAQIRYWLWLAASLKFLIPFSLLVGMGSHLASPRAAAAPRTGLYFAMEQVGQPFTRQAVPPIPNATPSTAFQSLIHLLPALLVVWLCGFVVVLFVWCVRWRRISAAVREAEPLRQGREVEVLRRLESAPGMPKHIEIRSSRRSLEPGIFGIAQPVLVWPHGITGRLEDEHLKSILAHELLHIRRRDNLAAAIHMFVEAVFWFHPLVWWMGTRLVEERERACDEEVVESGSDPQVYAESILKICEFCVGSPLPCISGVTGAELKSRITRIMSDQIARKLDLRRKLLLGVAAILAVAAPIATGILHASPSRTTARSESAASSSFVYRDISIKLDQTATAMLKSGKGAIYQTNLGTSNGLAITNTPLQQLIEFAYEVQGDRIAGTPAWFNTELFDVDAKIDSSTADKLQKLDPDQRTFARRRMLQALLADHFKLAVHRETRQLPVYALLIAESGPKLKEATPGNIYADGVKGPDGAPLGPGKMTFGPLGTSTLKVTAQALPIPSFLRTLSLQVGRTVLDMTGLTGNYDFTLQWAPLLPKDAVISPASGSSIFQAVRQQLGLKLEPKTAPLEMLVIDHAELPSASNSADTTTEPAYESVSITPNKLGGDRLPLIMFGPDGFSTKNTSLQQVIRLVYGVEDDRIVGAPAWLASDKYDVEAKESSDADDPRRLSPDQRVSEQGRMLQAVLADRLKLVLHRETRDLSVLTLAIAKGGPKLQESKPGDTHPNGFKGPGPDGVARPGGIHFAGNNKFIAQGVPIRTLQSQLSWQLRRTILDETGLSGTYDFTLQLPDSVPLGIDNQAPPESYEPALSTAIEQQLGVKLEPRRASLEVLVIDHVEKPSAN
jgi:bla regulator protein BlaR1